MKNIFILSVALALVSLSACTKDHEEEGIPCNINSGETLTATFSGMPWEGCNYTAAYDQAANLFFVSAVDGKKKKQIKFYIPLDPANPAQTYPLTQHTSSALEFVRYDLDNPALSGVFYPDMYKPNTGGSVTITQFDAVNNRVSLMFNAAGYNPQKSIYDSVKNGNFINLKFERTVLNNDKSYISADINGRSWVCHNFFTKSITTGGPNQILQLKATGYFLEPIGLLQYDLLPRQPFDERFLSFYIPVHFGTGTYNLYPEVAPYFYQTSTHYNTFSYSMHSYDDRFQPSTGSITVAAMDQTNRNMDATFTAQTKDASGTIVNFTNGKIHIENWVPF